MDQRSGAHVLSVGAARLVPAQYSISTPTISGSRNSTMGPTAANIISIVVVATKMVAWSKSLRLLELHSKPLIGRMRTRRNLK